MKREAVFSKADRSCAEALFACVADKTRARSGGMFRPSYGIGESIALQIVAVEVARRGLTARVDAAGNLVFSCHTAVLRGDHSGPPATWIGSHLDSVPNGGNYDGLAGVVAAVLVVSKAKERKIDLPLVGIGLRGEESAWFGVPYLGSKAILGKLGGKTDLDRCRRPSIEDSDTPTLGACMEAIGLEPDLLIGQPVVPLAQIREFWELHIEQGPLLVARDKPVGIVTGIRGNVRAPNARIVGKAGHSGTTPHELRDDAVMKFVEVMTKLEMRRAIADFGDDLVFTCGVVGTDPKKHAITTIADEIRFALDVRSISDHYARQFMVYAEGCGLDLGEVVTTPSAIVPEKLWQRAASACARLGVEHEVMPSGAGHDAAVFANAGVPAGMIFVRNENGSHNPDEAMSIDDFMLGCEVLWETIVGGPR